MHDPLVGKKRDIYRFGELHAEIFENGPRVLLERRTRVRPRDPGCIRAEAVGLQPAELCA